MATVLGIEIDEKLLAPDGLAANGGADDGLGNGIPSSASSSSGNANNIPATPEPTKAKRGRPKLSDEEKERRARERGLRLLQGQSTVAQLAKQAGASPEKVAALTVAPKVLTKEEIAKAQRVLEKSFSFIGDIVLEIVCEQPAITLGDERAKDLAEAWAEILAENLGENAADVVKWTTALAVTGFVVQRTTREVREHNKKNKKGL